MVRVYPRLVFGVCVRASYLYERSVISDVFRLITIETAVSRPPVLGLKGILAEKKRKNKKKTDLRARGPPSWTAR